jgi:glucan-binding YG repeat protein
VKDVKATCTENGLTGRTYCDVCESIVDWGTEQAAAGHDYVKAKGVVSCKTCGGKLTGMYKDKYYIEGVLANGWVNDTYYYVDGVITTGHRIIGGTMYNYKNGERRYAGLIEIDGGFYYVNSSCKVVTGGYYVNVNNGLKESNYYFFDETGRMDQKTGIYKDSEGILRYYENGFMFYGGLHPAGTYTFDGNGKMIDK